MADIRTLFGGDDLVLYLSRTQHGFKVESCAPRWCQRKLAPTGKRQAVVTMGTLLQYAMNGLASRGSMSRSAIGCGSVRELSRYVLTYIATRERADQVRRISRGWEHEASRSRAAGATESE